MASPQEELVDQELKDYLDRQKVDLDRQFAELRETIDRNRDGIHQNRILIEGLNDKIETVAEGVSANTEVLHRLAGEKSEEIRETRQVLEAAHRHLEGRVSRHDEDIGQLGRRVALLEGAKA